jgi:hypothetical protein
MAPVFPWSSGRRTMVSRDARGGGFGDVAQAAARRHRAPRRRAAFTVFLIVAPLRISGVTLTSFIPLFPRGVSMIGCRHSAGAAGG